MFWMQGGLFKIPKVSVWAMWTIMSCFWNDGKSMVQEAMLIKEFGKIEST